MLIFLIFGATVSIGIILGLHAQIALMLLVSLVAIAVGFAMPYKELPGILGEIYIVVVGTLMLTAWITFFCTQPNSINLLHNLDNKLFR